MNLSGSNYDRWEFPEDRFVFDRWLLSRKPCRYYIEYDFDSRDRLIVTLWRRKTQMCYMLTREQLDCSVGEWRPVVARTVKLLRKSLKWGAPHLTEFKIYSGATKMSDCDTIRRIAERGLKYANQQQSGTYMDLFTHLLDEIARLDKNVRILEVKNAGTLANNLCPDHRDKQVGKPCLACTIETLERQLANINCNNCPRSLS